MCSHLFYLLFFFNARTTLPYFLGAKGCSIYRIFFEVFSHFEAGAVYVHNPASCILSWLSWEEEEEAADWQDM